MSEERRTKQFSEKECQDIYFSLCMRANLMETGNVVLSRSDLENRGRQCEIKKLDADQQRLVARLRVLADEFLQ